MSQFILIGLFTGKVAPLGADGFLSAIVKEREAGPISVSDMQFGDDEVHDKKYHGGSHRVVHQYSSEHYPFWQDWDPTRSVRYQEGSYGENICTQGVTEQDVCIGDTWALGSCILQLSEPRYPCATLNRRYGNDHYLKHLLSTTRWGWFYRVLQPGVIQTQDKASLLSRPHPQLTVAAAIDMMMRRNRDRNMLEYLASTSELSPNWQKKIKALCK